MKKITAMIMLVIMIILVFCSCSKSDKIAIVNSEISASGDGTAVKFTVTNNTGEAISGLMIDVEAYDENSKLIKSDKAEYPLQVENGASATLSIKSTSKCKSAKAISYSYKKANGKQESGSFKANNTVQFVVTTTSDGKIRTRQDLAEKLLADIKTFFLKNKYYTDGEYNAETNQLMVAAYCDLPYKACKLSYQNNPQQWDELATNMAQMSKTCLEEFKSYGFNDVQINIAMMSSDDMPVVSVVDGEVDITPAEDNESM